MNFKKILQVHRISNLKLQVRWTLWHRIALSAGKTLLETTFPMLRKFYKINSKLLTNNLPKPRKGLVWFWPPKFGPKYHVLLQQLGNTVCLQTPRKSPPITPKRLSLTAPKLSLFLTAKPNSKTRPTNSHMCLINSFCVSFGCTKSLLPSISNLLLQNS